MMPFENKFDKSFSFCCFDRFFMLVNFVMQEMSFTAIFYAGPQVSEQQN